MKKMLSIFLALTMLISCFIFTSCQKADTVICDSCGEENLSTVKFCSNCGECLEAEDNDNEKDDDEKDDSEKDDSEKTTPKTAKEKLCEYIIENGANYQGTYKIIKLGTSDSTTISCTGQGDIIFSYYTEGQNNKVYISLKFYDGSVTQTVEYQYEQRGYTCITTGTLYTNMVSNDNCTLYGITYRENFPSSVNQSSIDKIVNMSHSTTMVLLLSVDAMLMEYVGIQLKDLGFTNW